MGTWGTERLAARVVVLSGLVCSASAWGQTYEFTGGRLFDGQGFVEQTFYSEDATLRLEPPASIDESFDLAGGYVVPPFAEAHNHDLASASPEEIGELIDNYLRDGVFYVKLLSAFSTTAPQVRPFLNQPDSVDVSFAFAPITGPGGHPIRLRETFYDRGWLDDVFSSKEEIAGIGYTLVRDRSDLEEKWPGLLAQEPDFIKFMLGSAEEYEHRRDDPIFFGTTGVDPMLAPKIVELAHAAGKRVSAHINTGPDFRFAVEAGVDEIAHMPGRQTPESIRLEDAKLAAKFGITVVTTLMTTTKLEQPYPAWYQLVMQQHRMNLERLKEAGVTIAIGSDLPYRDTSLGEAMLIHSLGVFTNLELLKMWCENSSRTIFPDRRIGKLEDGYEASFLVLGGNPLEDFSEVKNIARRFKQGMWLTVPEPAESER